MRNGGDFSFHVSYLLLVLFNGVRIPASSLVFLALYGVGGIAALIVWLHRRVPRVVRGDRWSGLIRSSIYGFSMNDCH